MYRQKYRLFFQLCDIVKLSLVLVLNLSAVQNMLYRDVWCKLYWRSI